MLDDAFPGMSGSRDKIDIACVVSDAYLLDFLTLYESLVQSWTYPFVLHAFAVDEEAAERLAGIGIPNLELHRLRGDSGDWRENADRRIDLVEQSGLERCIVTDADNLFLAETPELALLLAERDLVFVAGPTAERPLKGSLWAFRRSEPSLAFARAWRARCAEAGDSDRGRVLADLLGEADGAQIEVLETPAYGVDADIPSLSLEWYPLGLRDDELGRVKVLHLAGLRGAGSGSLSERLDAIVDRFPRAATLVPFYATLAGRAAGRLGIEVAGRPKSLARERLYEGGLIPARNQLPDLLNRRGLDGTGVEVGVRIGIFSENILRRWRGRTLISVDPWLESAPDEAQDRTQAEHDQFYEETVARLGKYGERSVIWRATSTEAAARIEPASLDFVYLDARHDYESVKEDLEHWFDKVRPGGIVAGHDYVDGTWGELSFGVKSAVDDFFGARGLPVKTTYAQTRPASWLVEMPAWRPKES
jgi:hypothetical protein